MRGRAVPISWSRRLMADAMGIAMGMPSVALQRVMALWPAVTARNAAAARYPWSAIMTKAYALTAQEFPELRRVYLKYPYPHFYEYAASVAAVLIERADAGEIHLLHILIKDPATQSIAELAERIQDAREAPMDQVKDFVRARRLARLPLPLRRLLWRLAFLFGRPRGRFFGTFGLAAIPAHGTDVLSPRTTWTSFLSYAYGSLNDDGVMKGHLTWDHRVFDAATAGRVLARFEEILNGPIADELWGGPAAAAADGAERRRLQGRS